LDNAARAQVRATTPQTARAYLFRHGYFTGQQLPEFISPGGFDQMGLEPLPPVGWPETTPLEYFAPKGAHSWRRFSLLHPFAYWHLVNTVTSADCWNQVQTLLGRHRGITAYTLPEYLTQPNPAKGHIRSFGQFERETLSAAGTYTHLVACDISNFYPSVYTHSVAWAFEGKEAAKRERWNLNLAGNRLDKAFRLARQNQTNGLPIGNLVSDLVSEVILADIDEAITVRLEAEHVDFFGARFRDDYKLLCRSEAEARHIIGVVSRVLHDRYDLALSTEKTRIFDDVVAGCTRPWSAAIAAESSLRFLSTDLAEVRLTGRQLSEALLATYRIQRAFAGGSPATTILLKLNRVPELAERAHSSQVIYSISLLDRIMAIRAEVIPAAVVVIDTLLGRLPPPERGRVLANLLRLESAVADEQFRQVWLLRLAHHHDPSLIEQFAQLDNPILQVIFEHRESALAAFPLIQGISDRDRQELEKFRLVDYDRWEALKGVAIPQSAVDVFASYTTD